MEHHEGDIQALVQAAQAGDEDSAGQLYDAFFQRIYRYFLYRVSGPEIAEDLTQTVFLEMVRSLPRYKQRRAARFSTWLFQIARHRLIDHYRQHRETEDIDAVIERTHIELRVDPAESTYDTRAAAVWQALERLPEKYRSVLRLAYVEDLDAQEIAALLGITAVNVRVLKHRGMQQLKDSLTTPTL